jgi:hypothetical protein
MNLIQSVNVWLAILAGIVGVTLLLMVFAGYFHTKVDATPNIILVDFMERSVARGRPQFDAGFEGRVVRLRKYC